MRCTPTRSQSRCNITTARGGATAASRTKITTHERSTSWLQHIRARCPSTISSWLRWRLLTEIPCHLPVAIVIVHSNNCNTFHRTVIVIQNQVSCNFLHRPTRIQEVVDIFGNLRFKGRCGRVDIWRIIDVNYRDPGVLSTSTRESIGHDKIDDPGGVTGLIC